MLANVEHLNALPEGQMQGREFAVTPAITLNAGKAMYLSGQTEKTAAMKLQHLKRIKKTFRI
ncbi:hypothetical protein [Saccharibacillus qingshengii]|uniref:hypothetical protein n=1 Tax=Saccharibacillus qingshengii TaxID=1763540 RepID=UPI0015526140|nr:hypothetical protein [Saccharibacillus qingshengii]